MSRASLSKNREELSQKREKQEKSEIGMSLVHSRNKSREASVAGMSKVRSWNPE